MMTTTLNLLFAYGTLQDKEVQLRVLGRVLEGKKDRLEGYELIPNLVYQKYPGVVANFHQSVNGMLYRILDADWALLDDYETQAYCRKPLLLKSNQTAWVYLPESP